jgi:hypothetical protein
MTETSILTGLERRREDYGLITGRSYYVDETKASVEDRKEGWRYVSTR